MSEHFTLEELTHSDIALVRGLDNTPSAAQVANLQRLTSSLLEPVRALLGVPLHVNSGFRSPEVNLAVGGVPTSAHMDGRAADVIPTGVDIVPAWYSISGSGLPFDQLILEHTTHGAIWLHLAIARDGEEPRRQSITLTKRENRAAHS